MMLPFTFVPVMWGACRLLAVPCNMRGVWAVTAVGYAASVMIHFILQRDHARLARDRLRLERFITLITLNDVLFITIGVHFAGGTIGPLWPFPFVPVILCAALLQSMRSLFINGAFAIFAAACGELSQSLNDVLGILLISSQFVFFCSMIIFALRRGTIHQRQVMHEIESARGDQHLAEAVAKRREEILSVVSHELASPLMTLKGYVRLMQESKSRDRDGHMLQRIDRQVTRISSLADDLLQMASTQTGSLRLRRQSFDLVASLRELCDGVLIQELEAQIEVTGEQRLVGVWDRDRLDQLFANLVSNAVKFAGARTRVTIDVQREGPRHVHVRVSDDGPGISPAALPRVFEPFQRYSSERGGLGLGLAIARTVAEMHEGKIWAESPNDERGGATIHVVLPTDMKPSGEQEVVDDSDPSVVASRRKVLT